MSENGDFKLGDFGIAKSVEKTMGGTKIGTYKYMAPEVYNNKPYGCSADIYSLGLVLYWLLNERRMPFMPMPPEKLKAGMDEEARSRRLNGESFPPPRHGSENLKNLVMKACAYDQKNRYSSATEMLEDIEKLINGDKVKPLSIRTSMADESEETVAIEDVVVDTTESTLTMSKQKSSKWWGIAAAVVVLILAVAVGIKAFSGKLSIDATIVPETTMGETTISATTKEMTTEETTIEEITTKEITTEIESTESKTTELQNSTSKETTTTELQNSTSKESTTKKVTTTENNSTKQEPVTEYKPTFTLFFDANGGECNKEYKDVCYGDSYGNLPTPKRENYVFKGWYTSYSGGKKVSSDAKLTVYEDISLYAQWEAKKYKVDFDANGGIVSTSSKTVIYDEPYGTLPVPKREYHSFDGWFTSSTGGTQIYESTVFNKSSNITVYAHWSENGTSDWVKSSEVPANAKIVDSKYKYTKTYYTTSNSSSLDGWEKYDTTSTWSSWSSWSAWQDSYVAKNDNTNVETQKVKIADGFTEYSLYYYRYYNNNEGYKKYMYTYGSGMGGTKYTIKVKSTDVKRYGTYDGHAGYIKKSGYYKFYGELWFLESERYVPAQEKTQYRYQTRSQIYTYHYLKKESLESVNYPSGENISNIQEWVRYVKV